MQNSWMDIQILAPIAGKDYPQTWNDFLDWFATEEACLAYLERLRWSDGFICPRCAHAAEAYRASRTRLMCRACQHQSSAACLAGRSVVSDQSEARCERPGPAARARPG